MTMTVKILGPGCRNCVIRPGHPRGRAALAPDATVAKVADYQAIMDYGVMTTPALVIDDRFVLAGRVPRPSALRQLLVDDSDRRTQTQATTEGNHP